MEEDMTLFNQNINHGLANKIDSFYSADVQGKRLTQKERVYQAIKKLGVASDREISELTGIPRYLIPDRRKSLAKEKRIKFVETKVDPITKKHVGYYRVRHTDETGF